MKVRNNKTGREYPIDDKGLAKLKKDGLMSRYTLVKEAKEGFKPKELKSEKA